MKDNAYEEYIKELKQEMPVEYKDSKKFLSSISRDIHEYYENHLNVTYEQLCIEFGSPQEVTVSLIENFDAKQVKEVLLRKKQMKKIINILLVLMLIMLFFVCIYVPHIGIHITDTVYIEETKENEN